MPKFMIDDKEATVDEVFAALQAVPKSRLDSQIEARKEAQAALAEANEKLSALPKLTKRLAEVEGEVGHYRTASELAALGITDAKAQKAVRAIYSAEIDGVEKPPSLTDWVKGDGAKHPMVAPVLGSRAGEGAAGGSQAGGGNAASATNRNGGATGGTAGSAAQRRLTGMDLQNAIAKVVSGKQGPDRLAALDAFQAEQAALPAADGASP